MVYEAARRKIAEIDTLGRETRYVYDKVGRLVETILPDATVNDWSDNGRSKTEYYSDGLVKAQIDLRGNRTEFRYDALGRQIAVIAADLTPDDVSDNPTMRYVYDKAGQQSSVTDALGRSTQYVYDDLGRMVKTVFTDESFTSQEYDTLGRRVGAIDQNGKRTEYRYDDLGRLTGVKNAIGDWTSYGYNAQGQLMSMTDAEGRTTRYEYDSLGRRSDTYLPLNQSRSQTYDEVGNLKTSTDFNGKTIAYGYDAQNRLTSKSFADGTKVTYSYTFNGLQDKVTFLSATGAVTAIYDYDYDVRDRLIKRTDTIDGVARAIEYGYDIGSNRTSVTTASGTTTYTYDERNRLDLVKQNGVLAADYDYDAISNLTQTTFGNGTRENRSYDTLNRLTTLETKRLGDNTSLSKYVYTLDKVGDRKSVTETQNGQGRSIAYTYDDLYRLTKESIVDIVNGDRTSSYVYDKVGNRLGKTMNGVTTAYVYDGNDRLINEKVNGTAIVTYGYDGNGSTIAKTENGLTSTYNRQALAFGDVLNQDLAQLRLGIRQFVLFDQDVVEETNLNRLHGVTFEDAQCAHPKVEVVARSMEALGFGIEVQTHQKWVNDRACRDALRSCDVVFGCTDDHAGRLVLNRYAYYYVTLVIDLGLAIEVSNSEPPEIQALDGRVTVLQPGYPCLLCREVINPTIARDELLKQHNPEEYERSKAEAYVQGEGNPNPSVVLFTTDVANMGLQELVHRLQGVRGKESLTKQHVRKFNLMDDRSQGHLSQPYCSVCGCSDHWAMGNTDPFLGLLE